MTRVTLAAGLALLVAVLVGATAAAHYPGAWWSKDELFAIETGYTTFTTSDTIRTRTREIDWTTTNAANMRHLAGHGYRFTLNNVDENDNLSATGRYSTNLPAPYYDRDFEGFFKCIEAEVTSESSSFPVAGTNYYGHFWYTYWYWVGTLGGWQWNHASGRIEIAEQVSEQYGFGDKWDTTTDFREANAFVGRPWYPAKSRPSTNPSSSDDPCQFDGGPTAVSLESDTDLSGRSPAPATLARGFVAISGDDPNEVVVRRDRGQSLSVYRRQAHRLAEALVESGPARAVVTFTRPLTGRELDRLVNDRWSVHSVEAVSDVLSDGTRLTVGDVARPDYWSTITSIAAEEGTVLLGITSAVVTLPNRAALTAAFDAPEIYLVDMAPEQISRSDSSVEDVVLNDVYWELAGWE